MKKILSLLLMLFMGMSMWATEVTDILTASMTGVTGTTYTDWSGKTSNSDAVYAGQSAAGNDAIQLRSKNSNSGIITTVSGGTIKKIIVTWNSNTDNGRTLDIYGKDAAYTSPIELYQTGGNSGQGTKLGSIVKGTSTILEISDNYEFIGMRSASGAMYIDKIEIIWEVGGTVIEKVKTPVISPESGTYETAQTVSITCETEDATILYKIDDAEYQEYNNPFVVNTNCTVYAKAIKETMDDSNIATATYKFPLFISKLIDIYNLSVGDEFVFTDTITCVDAQGRYLYVQDESGAALIYGAYGSDYQNTYITTNVIPANWKGKISTYAGNKQITPTSELGQPLEGNNGQPIVRNIVATEIKTDITEVGNDLFKYCVIKKGILSTTDPNGTRDNIVGDNLWITTEDGTHKAYTKTLGIAWIDENFDFSKEYDVYGVLGSYYGTPQLLPMGVVNVNEGTVTDNIDVVDNSIKKVTYINTQGIQSSKPFDGLNIVVTEFENGTKNISKQIYKF